MESKNKVAIINIFMNIFILYVYEQIFFTKRVGPYIFHYTQKNTSNTQLKLKITQAIKEKIIDYSFVRKSVSNAN